jgi:hypothetical protein
MNPSGDAAGMILPARAYYSTFVLVSGMCIEGIFITAALPSNGTLRLQYGNPAELDRHHMGVHRLPKGRTFLIPHSTSINQKTQKNNLFSLKTQGFRQVWFLPNG